MAERDTFIRAIIAERDDDLPRLIFADWLEENGEGARAEFIRVQIDLGDRECLGLAKNNPHCGVVASFGIEPCDVCDLRRRERELLVGRWDDWMPDAFLRLPSLCGNLKDPAHMSPRGHFRHVAFRRGFVEEIACPWEDWCRHADAVRAATPLRTVRLTTMPPVEAARGTRNWRDFRLPGRRWHTLRGEWRGGQDLLATAAHAILPREWPGVEFELPPVSQLVEFTIPGMRSRPHFVSRAD